LTRFPVAVIDGLVFFACRQLMFRVPSPANIFIHF